MPTCLPLKLLNIPIIITTFLSLLALATQANAILAAAAATAEPDINADAAAFAHASLFEECSSLDLYLFLLHFQVVVNPALGNPQRIRHASPPRAPTLRNTASALNTVCETTNRMYHDTSFALADESRDHLRHI